jgi:hypothetical protein
VGYLQIKHNKPMIKKLLKLFASGFPFGEAASPEKLPLNPGDFPTRVPPDWIREVKPRWSIVWEIVNLTDYAWPVRITGCCQSANPDWEEALAEFAKRYPDRKVILIHEL